MSERQQEADVSIERRREIVAMKGITLDGRDATVTGTREPFAMVMQVRTGVGFQWAWPTVDRIVKAGGRFVS